LVNNKLSHQNNAFELFDIEFYESEFIVKEVVIVNILILINHDVFEFTIDCKGFLEKEN